MPLVNSDVKSLELFVAADWYNDEVLKDELLRGINTHADNQKRFKLPDRVTAKRFIFKLIFGATAFGYASDSDFINVGFTERKWQGVIDEFYAKYTGISRGHARDIKKVKETGILEIPSGRFFEYRKGKYDNWPLTKIKNYPIQGFGADLVMLYRIEAFKRFKESGMEGEFICTIHDSLVYDVPSKNVEATAKILKESVAVVHEMCYNIWSYKFSLPLRCEVSYGPNKFDLQEI